MYTPDNWVLIKLDNIPEPHYKVLAGWSGGYSTGDSWRINSGVVRHEEDEKYYYFYGHSGSCYTCGKQSEGLRANNAFIWDMMRNKHPDKVSLVDVEEGGLPEDWKLKESS